MIALLPSKTITKQRTSRAKGAKMILTRYIQKQIHQETSPTASENPDAGIWRFDPVSGGLCG